jgi:hypothetical protein
MLSVKVASSVKGSCSEKMYIECLVRNVMLSTVCTECFFLYRVFVTFGTITHSGSD